MTTLRLLQQPEVPLEAECLRPDLLAGKTASEIAGQSLYHGNRKVQLGEFFQVAENGADLVIEGDCSRVKLIGAGMTQGRLLVQGNAGMHLGAGMCGGRIEVTGNVGDWAGAEMRGGEIHVRGSAGHAVGAAYRGSPMGMDRGLIYVAGNAGNEVAAGLRRGLVIIGGDTGDFAGSFMLAGSLLVFGRLGQRPGAGLKRGSIIAFSPVDLLPTYRYACTFRPAWLAALFRSCAALGIPVPEGAAAGRYHRYCGDLTTLGKGEILVGEGL
jgi:formylmethanofuran dehydrogenase subunit C